jgi:glycosyltransferase involved in cell wall biosynthesis
MKIGMKQVPDLSAHSAPADRDILPIEPKKLLFVITKSNWGGAQKYVFDLATNLPKGKFEAVVAFGGTGSDGAAEGELATRLRSAGIRTIFVESFARDIRLLAEFHALFELIRIFRAEKPDIVHLNSSKAGGIGALAARVRGIRNIIFTVHGSPIDEDRNPLFKLLIDIATRLTFSLCRVIIVVSQNDLARAKSGKANLIYSGIKAIDFGGRQEARAKLVSEGVALRREKDVWVATNAELHPNKNLFTAIDAVARHNETHFPKIFYLIMSGGELRKKLEEDIARRRIREHVMLLGFVENAPQYLKAFDIFFLPSKKEGLPYALLEAGAAALPVVASNIGGIPEIVEDGVSGSLCKPDDAEGFSEALGKLAADPALRERFGEALEAHVKKGFSFERMIEQTIALY